VPVYELRRFRCNKYIDICSCLYWPAIAHAPPDTPAPFREARLLTDMSGPYFTLVVETEFESMADWEDAFSQLMAAQGSGEIIERMNELTRSGHREFFRIEN
jgi:hypothetical protein